MVLYKIINNHLDPRLPDGRHLRTVVDGDVHQLGNFQADQTRLCVDADLRAAAGQSAQRGGA